MLPQPKVSLSISRLLLSIFMARPVDLDDETPLLADEVDNEIPNPRLPAELGAFASPVSNGAPDKRFGLHQVSALLAGEAKQDGARNVRGHGMMLARRAKFCNVQSRLASLDTPHPSCFA